MKGRSSMFKSLLRILSFVLSGTLLCSAAKAEESVFT